MEKKEKREAARQEPGRTGKRRLRVAALCMAAVGALSVPAFAADVTVSGVLSDAAPVITTAVSTVWDLLTSNPICIFALGCAIVSVGFRFLRKAIRVSHKA